MIALAQVAEAMPEVYEARPDLVDESVHSKILLAATQLAEQNHLIERDFDLALIPGVSAYALDVCESEKINYLLSACWQPEKGCEKKCFSAQRASLRPGRGCDIDMPSGSCALSCYGGVNIRFVLPNVVELWPSNGLSGLLTLTASVAPCYDACELDDLFLEQYKLPLMYGALHWLYSAPGEGKNLQEATRYGALFRNEATRAFLRNANGNAVGAATAVAARRLV